MFKSLIKTAPLNDGTKGFRFVILNSIQGIARKRHIKNRYELTKGPATVGAHFGKFSVSCNYRKALRQFHRIAG